MGGATRAMIVRSTRSTAAFVLSSPVVMAIDREKLGLFTKRCHPISFRAMSLSTPMECAKFAGSRSEFVRDPLVARFEELNNNMGCDGKGSSSRPGNRAKTFGIARTPHETRTKDGRADHETSSIGTDGFGSFRGQCNHHSGISGTAEFRAPAALASPTAHTADPAAILRAHDYKTDDGLHVSGSGSRPGLSRR